MTYSVLRSIESPHLGRLGVAPKIPVSLFASVSRGMSSPCVRMNLGGVFAGEALAKPEAKR